MVREPQSFKTKTPVWVLVSLFLAFSVSAAQAQEPKKEPPKPIDRSQLALKAVTVEGRVTAIEYSEFRKKQGLLVHSVSFAVDKNIHGQTASQITVVLRNPVEYKPAQKASLQIMQVGERARLRLLRLPRPPSFKREFYIWSYRKGQGPARTVLKAGQGSFPEPAPIPWLELPDSYDAKANAKFLWRFDLFLGLLVFVVAMGCSYWSATIAMPSEEGLTAANPATSAPDPQPDSKPPPPELLPEPRPQPKPEA